MSMRNYSRGRDDERPQIDSDSARFYEAVVGVIAFAVLLALLTWWGIGHAATTTTRQGGSSDFACCEDANCTIPTSPQYARDWAAKDACAALVEADGKTRYFRQWPMRIDKTGVTPPPTCPTKPADDTRTASCAAPAVGSWTQTQSYGSVAYPTCWVPSGYIPTAPPAGACVTPSPGLTAPTLAATMTPNVANPANTNVTLSWTAIPGATGYDIERCTGAGCTNFSSLGTASADSQPAQNYLNQPPGLTWLYRVRAFAGTTKGPYATPLAVTTPTSAPPAGTGSAAIAWTPPTTNTDGSPLTTLAGFRIVYGASATALASTIDVPNASLTSYVVDKLAAGTWYFAVRAYTSAGYESENSNVVSKVTP